MKKNQVQHDQYFTKKDVAIKCYNICRSLITSDFYIEPSAGIGSFYNLLPSGKRLGFDIQKLHEEIIQSDFLKTDIDEYTKDYKSICFIGNPPFGKNANLAVSFFNHCAKYGKYIALILPRTFRKFSVIKRLNKNFHLIYDELLQTDSFHLKDKTEYPVHCIFQIWEKRNEKRIDVKPKNQHSDFNWTSKEDANLAIRRVGINAGKVFENTDVNVNSHYFIDVKDKNNFSIFHKIYSEYWKASNKNIDICKYDTVGNPSISKSDIVKIYTYYKGENIC